MSANAPRTRRTTTTRRMSALRAFDGYGVGFERWTDEASTAARALRLRVATAQGYRGHGLAEPGRSATRPASARNAPSGPTGGLLPATVAAARLVAPVDRLELLEAPPGADGDAGERALREVHGHLRLVAQPLVETREERPAAGEDDAPIHDVRRELGR